MWTVEGEAVYARVFPFDPFIGEGISPSYLQDSSIPGLRRSVNSNGVRNFVTPQEQKRSPVLYRSPAICFSPFLLQHSTVSLCIGDSSHRSVWAFRQIILQTSSDKSICPTFGWQVLSFPFLFVIGRCLTGLQHRNS